MCFSDHGKLTLKWLETVILMYLEYNVMLPDHDFRIGEKHKLVLSVYAAFLAKEDEIGFNWPTLISVRRGKHDKSCPETYSNDFESILQMKEF